METNLAEQLAEVQAARRALALEAETSAAAHHRDLEGLAISALELQTVLQELSREKVHRLAASTDLTAARRRLSELNMELLLAQADAERGGHKEKGVPEAEMERSQADEALGKRKAQALEALKAAKASVQIYEDCCQELRSELSAAQACHAQSSERLAPSSKASGQQEGNVFWCRKVPPTQGLHESASAPSLR